MDQFLRAITSIAVLGMAAGCVSVLPEPDAPNALLELPDARASAPAGQLRADVVVYAPDSNRAFAGVNIPVRDEQELVFLSDMRWADAAPRLLQGGVVNALSKASGDGAVATAELATRGDYDLRWRIIDLSVTRGTGPVNVVVEASLVESLSRRIVAQDRMTATRSPDAASSQARAAALAIAAQEVSDLVAAFVVTNAVDPDAEEDQAGELSAASSNR